MSESSKQLSLFDTNAVPVVSKTTNTRDIEWSYSRHNTFNQCLLRYYYYYFASKKKVSQDLDIVERLRFLKQLDSRYTFAGTWLHRIIQNFFLHAQNGDYWDLDRLLSWAEAELNRSREKSLCHVEGRDYKNYKKHEPSMLLEYIYEFEDADESYKDIQSQLSQALTNFYKNEVYEVFRVNGCKPSALVEKQFNLTQFPFKVTGQVDLAYEANGTVVLVDWKLGSEDNIGSDSLQLLTYALWAIDYFACQVDNLYLYKAFLGSSIVKEFEINDFKLERARVFITQSAERLAHYQTYGELAVEEPFTPCLHENVCQHCPFQGNCYD